MARQRGGGRREVRQEAGRGRSVAAARHQGAAHARRGPRQAADGDARRAGRPPVAGRHGADGARAGRALGQARDRGRRASPRRSAIAWSCSGFSTRVMRGDRIGLIGPERRRQDHAAAAAARRAARRTPAPCATAPTCRWPTTISSASSSIPSVRSSTPSATATTASTVAGRDAPRARLPARTSCSRAERARSPVKALSGGERNRLLLARLFTRPANVLVLDEPTNDLDLETLELLEAQLVDWPGTLLLVSHDRRFLDHVVTSTHRVRGQRPAGGVRGRLRRLGAAAAAAGARGAPGVGGSATTRRRIPARSLDAAAQGHQQGARRSTRRCPRASRRWRASSERLGGRGGRA